MNSIADIKVSKISYEGIGKNVKIYFSMALKLSCVPELYVDQGEVVYNFLHLTLLELMSPC